MKKLRMVSFILLFAFLFQIIGCSKKNNLNIPTDSTKIEKTEKMQTDGFTADDSRVKQPTEQKVKTEQVTLSADQTSAEICDIKVDVGDFVLDGEEELVVTVLEQEVLEEEDKQIDVYEISIGDKSELNDFITIRMPYRTDFCDAGEDPAECVQGQYKNEETGLWEIIPYSVDKENQEVVIMTDHLSKFGVCYVRNAGARNAYVSMDIGSPDFEDSELAGIVEEYLESTNKSLLMQETGATVLDNLFSANEAYDKYARGYADNLAKLFTIGEKDFGGLFHEKVSSAMEGIGYAVLAIKTANLLVNDGSNKDKLDLINSVSTTAISYLMGKLTSGGSAYFNCAMVAVWIFGEGVNYAYNKNYEIKMEKLARLYEYFNEECNFSTIKHTARSLEDWRMEIIKIIEENQNTPEQIDILINQEIDTYLAKFWNIGLDNATLVSSMEYESRGREGGLEIAIPMNWQEERDQITADYKHNLLIKLVPVKESIAMYFKNKAIQEYQNMLNEVEYYFNTPIETYVYEIIDEDEQTYKYPGYTVQFGPLSEDADIETWTTGTIDENGQHKTSFTILGYLISGSPTEVYLYEPDADLFEDEPAEILQLSISEIDKKAYAGIDGGVEGRFEGTYTNISGPIEVNSTTISNRLHNYVKNLEGWTPKDNWESWLTERFNEELSISGKINVEKVLPNDPGDNEYDMYFTVVSVINNIAKSFPCQNYAKLEDDQFKIYEGMVKGTLDVTIDEEEEIIRITGNNLEFAFTGEELNAIVGELAMPVNYEAYYLYFDVDATKPLEAGFETYDDE
ncbi:MAG TPA: hypothetical protein GXZ43_08905 [Clostridiaceae bacterium]|nr:hypothetical protein [Clostridiaceae bacterium]